MTEGEHALVIDVETGRGQDFGETSGDMRLIGRAVAGAVGDLPVVGAVRGVAGVGGEQDDALFGDFVAGEAPLPEERVEDTLRYEALTEALALLDERQQTVIVLRYGLRGSEPKTLDEIGRRLGVSRERVRQLETEALKHLARMRETQSLAR